MTIDSTILQSSTHRWWVSLCVGFIAGALVLTGCDSSGGEIPSGESPGSLNAHEALSLPQYSASTFESILEQEGVNSTISGAGSVTVFAPVDNAFNPLDMGELGSRSGLLTRILNHHVVTGSALMATNISDGSDGQAVTTEEGSELTLRKPDNVTVGVGVNGATVSNPNIEAANGVVHFLDQVILEQTTVHERLDITAALDTLNDAVDEAGITSNLDEGNGPFTVFAPTDNVVGSYHLQSSNLTAGNSNLFADPALGGVLQNHVVSGTEYTSADLTSSSNVGSSISTMNGELSVDTTSDGTLTLDGVPVTTADRQVRNGVIHMISDLLLEEVTIMKRAAFTKALDSFSTNIDGASPSSDLSTAGPYTVFAPVNSAFSSYDDLSATEDDALQNKILDQHVVSGNEYSSSDLISAISSDGGSHSISTDQGNITVDTSDSGVLRLNGNPVVTTVDLGASNGVVHLVGDLLVEHLNVRERTTVEGPYSIFERLIEQLDNSGVVVSSLKDQLEGSGPLTVFPPTNEAFINEFDGDGNGQIESSELPSDSELQSILEYHVVSGQEIMSGDVSTNSSSYSTEEGSDLTLSLSDGTVVVNGSINVEIPDQNASNGVVQGVGEVLSIPQSN